MRHLIRNLLVSSLIGLLITIGITLLEAPYPVYADGPAPALVVVQGDYTDLQAVRRQVEQVGGRVEHIFPPDTFIARLTPTQAEQIRLLPQVASITFDPAPTLSGAQVQAPLAIWNNVFHGPAIRLQVTAPFSDKVLVAPDLPGRITLALPYGAGYYDTSTYMLGDVVVALVLPESNGVVEDSTQDWTASEVASVQSTTVAGLDKWVQAEPNAKLTFIYIWADAPPAGGISNTVESDYEAEKRSNFDSSVINSFMARLGYTNFNYLVNIRNYLNDLRTAYDTDWAYLVQIRDDERTIENSCGVAGAYSNGPTLTMYDCDLRGGYVVAHESGHIFGARDEYCPGACISPINRYGYLQTVNANSVGPSSGGPGYFGGKGEGLSSIMLDSSYSINPYTRGQVGWRDADGDGILDVRDTFPDTSLGIPSVGSSLVIDGQATVVPWRGAGNDISLNTIAGADVRLNNLTWLPTAPNDGAFDGSIESFNLTLPLLPDGVYTVEARGHNDVGNVEHSYATITFTVSGSPVTNATPFAAFQVTPARASVTATSSADASASADLEGQPLQARWDWENDGTWDTTWSATLAATHNYTVPGTKIIALQLRDSLDASATVTRSVQVTSANTLPLPFFVVSDGDSRFGSTLPTFTFDASGSSDGETALAGLQFRWDFNGDNIFDTGWTTTPVVNDRVFALTAQGQADGLPRSNHWSVILEVQDGDGATAQTTRHIWGNPYDHAPVVSGIFSTNTGNTASPIPLDFSLTSDADIATSWDGLLEYQFDWDSDGNWDTDFAPASAWNSYRLTQPGVYSITMQAQDRYGATDQASELLTIINLINPPQANFYGSPTSGVAPLTVNLTNLSAGNYDTCAWTFGDGGTSNGCANPNHIYTVAGVYTVSLTVDGPGGTDTLNRSSYITVYDPVQVDFSGSPTSGVAALTVSLTNLSAGDYNTCAWTFGDGGTSNSCANPNHIYTVAGVYTVTLTVDGPGGTDTLIRSNYITVSEAPPSAPVADFSASPLTGQSPLTVVFTDTSTGSISSWLWDFGDGATSSLQNPSHPYTAAGVYSVTLTVDGPGGTDTLTRSNYITVSAPPPAPVADFSASPLTGQSPLTVVFTDTSTGSISSWLWDFGDGATSSLQNPSHPYTVAGVYTVALTVDGPGGTDTLTRSNYITVTTRDSHMQVYGYVDSFPAGLIGDWVVNGVTYTADASTQFEHKYGNFADGVCVEVKYLPATNQALETETEHDYKCAGGGSQYSETYGVVDDFPPDLIGEWVVDAITYVTNINTQFEQEHGPFFVGGCVEVKYIVNTNTVVEVGTAKPNKCGVDGRPGKQKFYGSIEVIPSGLIGIWTIGGEGFVTTAATEFEEEHGGFAPGLCVEVEYYKDNGVNIATQIETESPYHCNGGTYTNEAYGLINSSPASLYGTWVINSTAYVASVGITEFKQEHGSFAVGTCVKVKYYTENGVNQVTKIKTEQPEHCQGGSLPGAGKLYASIDGFPPDPYMGGWMIGGAVFTTTDATEFEQEHGSFAVGMCVKAKYTPVNGDNFLIKVETEHAYKCQDSGSDELNALGVGDEFKAYGIIEVLSPGPAFTGIWQVSGINYQVGANTHLEEVYGFFTVGAYVEVRYVTSDTVRLVTKIETHVAPGAGATTRIGVLETHDSGDDWNDWVVGSVTYAADPAIEVGTGNQFPQVGQMVHINVYENAGTRYVATVARAHQLFLPVVLK